MADHPPPNASDFYNYVYEKPLKDAYDEYCTASKGNKRISRKQFDKFFEQLVKGTVHGSQNSRHVLRYSDHAQYSKVFYDVIKTEKVSLEVIKKCHEKFCKLAGASDVMTYLFYKHCFYFFLEQPYQLEMGSLPIDVMMKVAESMDYLDRCVLRKVCRSLHEHIDLAPLDYLEMEFSGPKAAIYFTENRALALEYTDICNASKPYRSPPKQIPEDSHPQMALEELRSMFSKRKFHLDVFVISAVAHFNAIMRMFESLPHQIHVESMHIRLAVSHAPLSIFPFFKPGILKSIRISVENTELWTNAMKKGMAQKMQDDVVNTEQWRQAKVYDGPDCDVMVKDLVHFDRVDEAGVSEMTVEDGRRIAETLQNSATFESLKINFPPITDGEKYTISAEFGHVIPEDPSIDVNVIHYNRQLPKAKIQKFQIKISNKCLEIVPRT